MAFLRFVVTDLDPDSMVETGLFQAAAELRDSPDISTQDRETLKEQLAWFSEHLEKPTRFNRTSSKGHYRRATKGISWFRDTAREHLARMHELKRIIEANGRPVTLVQEKRVGYVVYEDEFQVVAEPFADTRTNA
jgi:hypothetical protein